GAALVDSRTEWPENTYPMYTAKLLCRLHALQDYYTWPALESTERIELGRTKITIADREQ
ncbi:hypothetical protein, partial [Nocardia cyriacigeorgica]|uniref:hypothetical protein n=1 Tax=Nocardia cyriacigeorgica TaxID=135487 RepID=UPI001E34B56D